MREMGGTMTDLGQDPPPPPNQVPKPVPTPKPKSTGGLSTGVVVGIVLGVAVIALLVGVAVGRAPLANADSRASALENDLRDSEAANATLTDQLDQAESDLAEAQGAADQAVQAALDEHHDELAALDKRIAARRAELKRLEQKIGTTQRAVAMSTFGDGVWQVGKDIAAGLYRAPGGSGCYWAELNSANNQDIATNGGFGPNQTVQIDSPWFESDGCGQWKKIG
jgi:F0F1-type ATP synthase membrane subunit b/b'